jgi:hypothetical protein
MYRLFFVPLVVAAGSLLSPEVLRAAAPIKLNGALVAGGGLDPNSLRFSPDSSRVLYVADQTTNDVFEVFSVRSTGGVATKLNGALVAGGNVSTPGPRFSPDSSRVLYLADQTTNDVVELFSVPSAGGTAIKLNGLLVSGGDLGTLTKPLLEQTVVMVSFSVFMEEPRWPNRCLLKNCGNESNHCCHWMVPSPRVVGRECPIGRL